MDYETELVNTTTDNITHSFKNFNTEDTNLYENFNENSEQIGNLNAIKKANKIQKKNKTLCATFTALMEEYLTSFQNHNVISSNTNSPIGLTVDSGMLLLASERIELNHVLPHRGY